MKISLAKLFLLGLMSISPLGCGHVTEYRYLDEIAQGRQDIYMHEGGHERLVRGRELDKVWIHPNFNIGKYNKIYIAPVEIAPGLTGVERSSQLADYFVEQLRDAIRRRLFLRVITTGKEPLPEKTLVLETGLTQLDRSGRLKNWGALLIGIYPVDPTHVQVEGRVRDARTGETLFIFADNRAGGPLFSADEVTWRRHIADIASDLVLELAAIKIKQAP